MIKIEKGLFGIVFLATFFILVCASFVSASRLPTVGGDNSTWGTVLNDYLSRIAGANATKLNLTMVNGTNIYSSSINTTHIVDETIIDEDISDSTNLTLGEKITFALAETIDNIVDGWIRITGNLNVTGNTQFDGNLNVLGNVSMKRPYGMFSSTQIQTCASANTAYPMTFNWTEDAYQIVKSSDNSNFSFQQTGDYLIELSIIVQSAVGDRAYIWVQKNGVNIPRSTTIYDFKSNNANAVIAVPFIIDMNITDSFRVMYAGSTTNVKLQYITNTSFAPETPSAIMTITKLSEIT